MIKGTSLFSNIGIAETYLERNGIDIVVANELLPDRAKFYKFEHPKTDVITGDITKKEVFDEVVKKSLDNKIM